MRQPVLAAAFALAFVSLNVTHAAPAVGYSRAAQRLLAQARAASGGAGWNIVRGWHETGRQGEAPYEAWFDPLRYGLRIETRDAAGLHVHGYNGQGDWRILPNGAAVPDDDPADVARTRTAAFFGASGFFHTARFDARGEVVGGRYSQGHAFDVVKVKPWGGHARELWFDRRSHLLARMIDRNGPKPLIQDFSDYRRVGPMLVAFRIAIDSGDPAGPQQRRLDSVVFAPADRALFSLPRP